MNSKETQRQPATDLLREIAAFVAEKDRLARRVDELLAANNATEEKRRIAVQELRAARATVEAQGKMLVTLQEQLGPDLAIAVVLSDCVERHAALFRTDSEQWLRAFQILDAGIDLYTTLSDPLEPVSDALCVFETRLRLPSGNWKART